MMKQSSFPELGEQSTLFDWFEENKKKLGVGLLALVAALISLLWYAVGSSSGSATDVYQAAKEFALFEKGDDAALKPLNSTLNGSKDLQAKYDGLIAQTLLEKGQPEQALPFANRTLERTSANHLPFYSEFARTSFLIASGKQQEALQQTEALKAEMLKTQANTDDALFAYTVLREAFLRLQAGEKDVWSEWKTYAASGKHPIFNEIEIQTVIGNVNLKQFIGS